jgi:hypothetical protein
MKLVYTHVACLGCHGGLTCATYRTGNGAYEKRLTFRNERAQSDCNCRGGCFSLAVAGRTSPGQREQGEEDAIQGNGRRDKMPFQNAGDPTEKHTFHEVRSARGQDRHGYLFILLFNDIP